MLLNVALFTLAACGSTAVHASPVHILGRRQDMSSTSEASSMSATPAPSSSADSSSSASGSAVPTGIQSAASSFQSSLPEPSGAPGTGSSGPSSERYPFSCPEDYLLTYAFNQISFDQSVEELLPVVNWTSPLYVQAQETEGSSEEAGATRTLSFYGNLSQEEMLDSYSYNDTDGGFLVQIWNLTNGPLQYSESPSLEILNYTTQLQLFANESDAGSTTVKLFSNLCVNDQTLGYTSFSAYLGTLLSNMRIAAANSNQIPGGTGSSPTSSASSASMSASGSSVMPSASGASSSGSVGVGGGVPAPVPTGSDGSSMASDASSAASTASDAASSMASDASSAAAGGAGGASSTASSAAAGASSTASSATSDASSAAAGASSTASSAAAGGASDASSAAEGASPTASSAAAGASDSASSAAGEASSTGGAVGGGGAGSSDSSTASPSPTSSGSDETSSSSSSSSQSGSAASATASTAVSGGEPLTLVTPGEVQTCSQVPLQYSGGNAPYFLKAVAAQSRVPLNEIPIQSTDGTYQWTPSIRSGTDVIIQLSDRNGNTVNSDTITVQQGDSTDCLDSV